MEYNKKLYETVEGIAKNFAELRNKVETDTTLPFSEVKKINIQLKKHEPVAAKFNELKQLVDNAKQAEAILNDSSIKDKDFIEMAKLDLDQIRNKIPTLEQEIKTLLLPVDPNNDKNVIVEMRPAAGGDESALFVSDLFDTYKRYFDNQKWKCTIMDVRPQGNGYSYLSFTVKGKDVYSKMKFESGVHRVQRVPATESKGRVHTSTITVAVLPELDDIEIQINPSDLRIDVYRASGAGGQHVNRTESAVRLTHMPTGIVVACQSERSQIENRAKAMNMLKAKLWQKAEDDRKAQEDSTRRSQVGTGERAEKIRTYNYPQNRITDHRIGLTLNKLDFIMQGGTLEELHDQLVADEQAKLMEKLKI